jgi:hypothetical protein
MSSPGKSSSLLEKEDAYSYRRSSPQGRVGNCPFCNSFLTRNCNRVFSHQVRAVYSLRCLQRGSITDCKDCQLTFGAIQSCLIDEPYLFRSMFWAQVVLEYNERHVDSVDWEDLSLTLFILSQDKPDDILTQIEIFRPIGTLHTANA